MSNSSETDKEQYPNALMDPLKLDSPPSQSNKKFRREFQKSQIIRYLILKESLPHLTWPLILPGYFVYLYKPAEHEFLEGFGPSLSVKVGNEETLWKRSRNKWNAFDKIKTMNNLYHDPDFKVTWDRANTHSFYSTERMYYYLEREKDKPYLENLRAKLYITRIQKLGKQKFLLQFIIERLTDVDNNSKTSQLPLNSINSSPETSEKVTSGLNINNTKYLEAAPKESLRWQKQQQQQQQQQQQLTQQKQQQQKQNALVDPSITNDPSMSSIKQAASQANLSPYPQYVPFMLAQPSVPMYSFPQNSPFIITGIPSATTLNSSDSMGYLLSPKFSPVANQLQHQHQQGYYQFKFLPQFSVNQLYPFEESPENISNLHFVRPKPLKVPYSPNYNQSLYALDYSNYPILDHSSAFTQKSLPSFSNSLNPILRDRFNKIRMASELKSDLEPLPKRKTVDLGILNPPSFEEVPSNTN